jgi:hypothetical protein
MFFNGHFEDVIVTLECLDVFEKKLDIDLIK